jgi:hypothetical protein
MDASGVLESVFGSMGLDRQYKQNLKGHQIGIVSTGLYSVFVIHSVQLINIRILVERPVGI